MFAGDTLLGEINGAGVAQAAYTWGVDGLVSERLTPLNKSLWYHAGPQGETRQLTDTAGSVADAYVYSAYGQPVASAGTDANPFRFGGRYGCYTDSNVGPALCTRRWYDPNTARWLSRDPIGYAGGDNLYAYVKGNPVHWSDPLGLDWVDNGDIGPGYNPLPVFLNGVGNDIQNRFHQATNSWNNALGTFGDWLTGLGPTRRTYGAGSSQSSDLQNSLAGEQIGEQISQGIHEGGISTTQAFLNTLQEPGNGTQAQVGGFLWKASPENGVTVVHAHNVMSFNSFWYHIPSLFGHNPFWDGSFDRPRNGSGAQGNIYQDYCWRN